MTVYPGKKSGFFFPEMTLTHFPKSNFWNFGWIFFPRMTLTHFPAFGFFFQDSRIGVNDTVSHLKIRRLKDGYEILACHKYRATP